MAPDGRDESQSFCTGLGLSHNLDARERVQLIPQHSARHRFIVNDERANWTFGGWQHL
jgi:hypothetical protein